MTRQGYEHTTNKEWTFALEPTPTQNSNSAGSRGDTPPPEVATKFNFDCNLSNKFCRF